MDWEGFRRRLKLAAATGILFLLAAILSDHVARQANGLETIWPGNAIVLGMLIARGRDRQAVMAIVAGGMLASLGFHAGRGDPVWATLLFGVANLGESLLAFLMLRRVGCTGDIFDRVSDVLALILACALACFVSATIFAAGALLAGDPAGFVGNFLPYYGSGVLSELVLAPMVMILAQLGDGRRVRPIAARSAAETGLVLGLVAVVTGTIFLWSRMPLLFLVEPFVLLATFRLRAFGAAGAVAIVAVVSVHATALGYGPVVTSLDSPAGRILLLQAFLACCFLTALPVAAMLAERDARAEEARQLAERFRAVVETIGEVIFRIDRDGRWSYLNPAWAAQSGQAIDACIGTFWLARVEQEDRAELAARLQAVLDGADAGTRLVARFATVTGIRWMEIHLQGLRDQDGGITGATGTLRDIDDRKRLEDHVLSAKRRAEQRASEATLLASTDELTGIANRRAFMAQLDREIAGAAEFGWPLSVAMFDVDHFKMVNDRHGHAVGDRVLQGIAARAAAAVRGGDLVGRLGGEEFGILMPGATAQDAAMVAERLRQAIETPRVEDGILPAVTVSIGIAAREDQREAALLLAAADTALYAAKGAGRNRVRIAA